MNALKASFPFHLFTVSLALCAMLSMPACKRSSTGYSEGAPSGLSLPEGTIQDKKQAQTRSNFRFQSLHRIRFQIRLKLYDLSLADSYDLSSKEIRNYPAKGNYNAVLTLQRKGKKKIIFTAAINAHGYYDGYVTLPKHKDGKYLLKIHKPG